MTWGNVMGFSQGSAVGFMIGGPAGAFWGVLIGSLSGAILAGTATNALFDKVWKEYVCCKFSYVLLS